jgi:hypothetical protein
MRRWKLKNYLPRANCETNPTDWFELPRKIRNEPTAGTSIGPDGRMQQSDPMGAARRWSADQRRRADGRIRTLQRKNAWTLAFLPAEMVYRSRRHVRAIV